MSSWEDFKNDASKVASKAAVKTGELADAAALKIKLQGLKRRLCEEYEKLGRLTYKASRTDEQVDCESQLAVIDSLRQELKDLEKNKIF